jgi:hypothetical protein
MLLKALTSLAFLAFFLIVLSIGCQWPIGMSIKNFMGLIPFGDKSMHFCILGTLTFLLNGSLRQKRLNINGFHVLVGSWLIALGITLEECSQAFIPSRNFELLDIVCNYAGIYAGSWAGLLLPLFKHKKATDASDRKQTLSVQTILHRTRSLHHEGRHGRRAARRLG